MLITAMDKLAALLLANPRAVLESGVPVPCGLRFLLDADDDETVIAPASWLPRSATLHRAP